MSHQKTIFPPILSVQDTVRAINETRGKKMLTLDVRMFTTNKPASLININNICINAWKEWSLHLTKGGVKNGLLTAKDIFAHCARQEKCLMLASMCLGGQLLCKFNKF